MKLLIGILLVFLLIGGVSTVTAKSLKVPMGYEKETDGYYSYTLDEEQHLYFGYMDLNNDLFENSTGYKVYDLGNNLYAFEDSEYNQYGIQEKITYGGEDCLLSIYKETPLSDTDLSVLKDDLMAFNRMNNVTALPV